MFIVSYRHPNVEAIPLSILNITMGDVEVAPSKPYRDGGSDEMAPHPREMPH